MDAKTVPPKEGKGTPYDKPGPSEDLEGNKASPLGLVNELIGGSSLNHELTTADASRDESSCAR